MGLFVFFILFVAACLDYLLAKSALIVMIFLISTFLLWLLTVKEEGVSWDKEHIRTLFDTMIKRMLYTVEHKPQPYFVEALLKLFHYVLVVSLWKLFVEPGFEFLRAPEEIRKLINDLRAAGSRRKSFRVLKEFILEEADEGRFPYNLLLILQGFFVCLFIRKYSPYAKELDELQATRIYELEGWLRTNIQELAKETAELEVEKDEIKLAHLLGYEYATAKKLEDAETHVGDRRSWLRELNDYMERVREAKREIDLHFVLREKHIVTYLQLKADSWFEWEPDGKKREKFLQTKISQIVNEIIEVENRAEVRLVYLKLRKEVEDIRNGTHLKTTSPDEEFWGRYLEKVALSLKDYEQVEKLDEETAQKLFVFAQGGGL